MIKYRHIETGLFLQKRSYGYSKVYGLSEKGTMWNRDCFGSLSKTKDPEQFGFNQHWKREEFEIVKFNLVEQ